VFRDGVHVTVGGSELFSAALPHGGVVALGALGFILKTIVLCWLQLTIRWTLPRFRYDQLMKLGWRKLLPASLANILVTGVLILAIQSAGPSVSHALTVASDVSKLVLALVGLGAGVAFVLFLLRPRSKRRSLASTSAQFAAALGGTREARMEA
jgi:NADH-quinone oxidoreductase subunit H